MKISTRLGLTILVPAFMGVIVVVLLAFSYQTTHSAQQNGTKVREIRDSITNLNSYVYSYLLYHEARPQQQFTSEYQTLSQLVDGIQISNPDQQALLGNIRESSNAMNEMFLQLESIYASTAQTSSDPLDQAARALLQGNLLIKSRDADLNASLLKKSLDDQVSTAQIRSLVLILIAVLLVSIPLTIALIRMRKHIASSLTKLRLGTEVVGAGNLNYRMNLLARDELGVLARSFDGMTQQLQTITVSRAALRDEVEERKKAEEAQQTTLNRFYSVLSGMPLGILLVTEEGLGEFCNQVFCDVFNLKQSPDDLRRLTANEIIEKIQTAYLNPEKAVARMREIVARGKPVKNEDVQLQGERAFLRDFVPIRLGENRYGRLWIYRDITERKRAESELLRINRELRAISACNQAIVRSQDEHSLLTEVCRILCDVAGYRMTWIGTVEHDQARTVRPVAWSGEDNGYLARAKITWSDSEFGRGPTGTAARTGKTEFCQDFATEPKMSPWRQEALKRGFCSSIAIPLFDNQGSVFAVFTLYAGEPNGFTPAEINLLQELAGDLSFGVRALRTLEERNRAEQALKESEERFLKAFYASPIAQTIASLPGGKWVYVNDSFLKMVGYRQEEVIGRTSSDINLFPDAGERAAMMRLFLEKGSIMNQELTVQTRTGKLLTVLSSNIIVNIRGQEHAISTVLDITERKRAEESLQQYTRELEHANRELESFSYTVSHDLRAPLRSMDGYSQALLEEYSSRLDQQGQKWLENIRTSSQRMGELIDDILGLAKVVRAELKFVEVDLSDLAGSVAAKLKEGEPNRQVEFVIMPGLKAIGDSNLLNLVLQNLLGNAFKFTSGRPDARIEFGVNQQPAGNVYFVEDNGAGFDMKYVNKLFQPFQRLHSDKEYPGTGIGLVTVQRIIRRHGGQVWAEGVVSKGATFYFTISHERS